MTASRREIALASAVVTAGVAVALTEGLSLVAALQRPALVWAWAALAVSAGFVARRFGSRIGPPSAGLPRNPIDGVEAFLLTGTCTVLAVVALTAIVAVPNTFDSMTYHLGRVAHWRANHGVAFYATGIPRQLYQAPGAEYLVAQLYVLFDGDRWVNMVQWSALVGSALGVSSIAGRLGADRKGQLLAALACVTLPMAVLQGSSTQNDLVATLWVVCSVVFGSRLAASWRLPAALLTGTSLGLALLTKATTAVFLAPFAALIPIVVYRHSGRRSWPALAFTAAIMVLLPLPHLLRTQEIFGHPLGPMREAGGDYGYLAETVSPGAVASGALRNLGLQAASSSAALNSWLETSIRAAHGALGIDPDDPRTTWGNLSFGISQAPRDEDAAGNPVHLLLLLVIVAGLLGAPKGRPRLLFYTAALFGGFLLFSATLKWTPWHTRLQLPLLVLATPLIGARLPHRGVRVTAVALAIAFVAAASPALLRNQRRPLLPPSSILQTSPSEQYFAGHPSVRQSYLEALRILEQEVRCADVGLAFGPDDYEYPLWALAGEVDGQPIRFTHVAVLNASARLRDPAPAPCAVLLSAWREERRLAIDGVGFEVAYDLGALRVLIPAEGAAALSPAGVSPDV